MALRSGNPKYRIRCTCRCTIGFQSSSDRVSIRMWRYPRHSRRTVRLDRCVRCRRLPPAHTRFRHTCSRCCSSAGLRRTCCPGRYTRRFYSCLCRNPLPDRYRDFRILWCLCTPRLRNRCTYCCMRGNRRSWNPRPKRTWRCRGRFRRTSRRCRFCRCHRAFGTPRY